MKDSPVDIASLHKFLRRYAGPFGAGVHGVRGGGDAGG